MRSPKPDDLEVVSVVGDATLALGETKQERKADGTLELRCHPVMVPIMEMMLEAFEDGAFGEEPAS